MQNNNGTITSFVSKGEAQPFEIDELFLKIMNMSISESWFALTVLVIRLVLKKAPKWVRVLL